MPDFTEETYREIREIRVMVQWAVGIWIFLLLAGGVGVGIWAAQEYVFG